MTNKIIQNAYRILGLLPNATTKEISKRLKNLDKLLKIGNVPDFDFDFYLYKKFRTKENIDNIRNIIFNPKEQILHYFFSIYLQSDTQINQMKKIESDFTIDVIQEYHNSHSDFIGSKNSALLIYLYLYINKNIRDESTEKLVSDCIYLWYEIIFSNHFYNKFKIMYSVDDEIGISEELLDTVQNEFQKEIVDAFSELAKIRKDATIVAELVDVFDLKDSNITIEPVEDCYKNIDKAIETLDSMNISEDGIFDDNEKRTLKENLIIVQNNLNKLMDYDLYDDSRTIVLRDRIVKIIRNQLLDLHNNLDERQTALKLTNFIIGICGTEGLKMTLLEDKKTIEDNLQYDETEDTLDKIKKRFDKVNLYTLDMNEITKLASDVNKLYKNMKITDEKISDLIFYLFRNLSVEMCNQYQKYNEGLLLLKSGNIYAKSKKAKQKFFEDLGVINAYLKQPKNNNTGCLENIIAYVLNILAYGIVYGGIALILAACNGG